jgi:hypothetical protein
VTFGDYNFFSGPSGTITSALPFVPEHSYYFSFFLSTSTPKAPFTQTVALPIFVMSDRFCLAVRPILPGSPTDFDKGIFLSLCLILCYVMSVDWMLTKIRQTAWQYRSDNKNQTDFSCFM